jgi:hypothetical protein
MGLGGGLLSKPPSKWREYTHVYASTDRWQSLTRQPRVVTLCQGLPLLLVNLAER